MVVKIFVCTHSSDDLRKLIPMNTISEVLCLDGKNTLVDYVYEQELRVVCLFNFHRNLTP